MKQLKKKMIAIEFESTVVNGRFNKFKQTLLMKACFLGNLDLVKYFTSDLKADPVILDLKDENCIFAAVRGNHEDVLSHLLTIVYAHE